jgi:ATP-dependent Clp protease adapter protein ClpS
VPRSARHTLILYAAGLTAQVVLLLSTLAAVAVLGTPTSPLGRSVLITFTFVNGLIFFMNLTPGATHSGLSTDGRVLWQLYLHAFRNGPHPLARQHAASPLFPPGTKLLSIEGAAPDGFAAGVQLLNDDTTPMLFVVEMLQKHLGLEHDAAIALMMGVHTTGGLLVPLADKAQAEAVAAAIVRDARAQGHQLACEAVEVPGAQPHPLAPKA